MAVFGGLLSARILLAQVYPDDRGMIEDSVYIGKELSHHPATALVPWLNWISVGSIVMAVVAAIKYFRTRKNKNVLSTKYAGIVAILGALVAVASIFTVQWINSLEWVIR